MGAFLGSALKINTRGGKSPSGLFLITHRCGCLGPGAPLESRKFQKRERKSFGCEGKSGLHATTCTSAFIKRPSSWIRADGELGSGCIGSRRQFWAQPLQGSVSLG